MNFWDWKLFADIVFVTFTGLGIAALALVFWLAYSGWREQRDMLREYREWEKREDEEVKRLRKEGGL